jgi:hypothetical protein
LLMDPRGPVAIRRQPECCPVRSNKVPRGASEASPESECGASEASTAVLSH